MRSRPAPTRGRTPDGRLPLTLAHDAGGASHSGPARSTLSGHVGTFPAARARRPRCGPSSCWPSWASVPSSSTAASRMAYGVTSTTLLLAIGTNSAAASATIHLAEIGTTLASGAAHWRFGNVDWKVVLRIGVPGALGAFAGATFLANLSTEVAAPVMSLLLLALGVYVLSRFTFAGLPDGSPGAAAAQAVPRAARSRGGLRRRHGRRRLGPGGHARPARVGPDRAPQGHRGPSTRASSSSRSPRRSGSSCRSARRGST